MGNILEVKKLTIQIDKRLFMRDVSFEINPGEAVLLSGTNGIGKSTLLKSILGLEKEANRSREKSFIRDSVISSHWIKMKSSVSEQE